MPATPIERAERCATYTRKSAQNQRDPEFKSIGSQRDICSASRTRPIADAGSVDIRSTGRVQERPLMRLRISASCAVAPWW